MTAHDEMLQQLHADLGWKRLYPGWAKLEILLGLLAIALSLFLLKVRPAEIMHFNPVWAIYERVFMFMLFPLGGYLTLAGQRSMIYQSNNALAAWLALTLERRTTATSDSFKELR